MSDKTELKARVLRNELAIIIGCQDGRSAKEKAEDVIAWMDRNDSRATIQPTAAEPVKTIVSYRPDTSKRKPCSYMKADGTCEKCRGSRDCVSRAEYEMVPVYSAAPVAPADAVRDARVLALNSVLNPANWTPKMDAAWHKELPNLDKAFAALLAVALKTTPKEPAK